jgi:hypothetical protein
MSVCDKYAKRNLCMIVIMDIVICIGVIQTNYLEICLFPSSDMKVPVVKIQINNNNREYAWNTNHQ